MVVKSESVTCLSFGGVSILHWRLRSDGTTHGSAQSSDFGAPMNSTMAEAAPVKAFPANALKASI